MGGGGNSTAPYFSNTTADFTVIFINYHDNAAVYMYNMQHIHNMVLKALTTNILNVITRIL